MSNRFFIEGECNSCGGTIMSVSDDAADDALITCNNCGQTFMTWGAYKAEALGIAAAAPKRQLGNIKGFKPS